MFHPFISRYGSNRSSIYVGLSVLVQQIKRENRWFPRHTVQVTGRMSSSLINQHFSVLLNLSLSVGATCSLLFVNWEPRDKGWFKSWWVSSPFIFSRTIFPFRTIGARIGIQTTLVACNRGNKLCHGCGRSCESPWLEILREIPARFPPTIQIQDSPAHYHFHIAVIMEHRCSGCYTTITPISTNHTHIAIASALELDLIQIRLNWYNDTTRHLASFCGDSSHLLPIAAQVYLHLLADFCHPSSQLHFYLSTLALAFPRPHVLCQTPGAHSHNCRSCALHSPCVQHTNKEPDPNMRDEGGCCCIGIFAS